MKFFPIMGDGYEVDDYAPLDLSIHTSPYYKTDQINLQSLRKYVAQVKKETNTKLLYGGYLEQRALYTSKHFTGDTRDIHLGVDVWADAGTPLYAPCDMRLHSMAYNDAELDYGYTLIYYIQELNCYLLLGHLSKSSLDDKEIGMIAKRGTEIATLGYPSENGGWEPHVHVQFVKDMGDYKGDYPGVCSQFDVDIYKRYCPDPREVMFG